MAFKAEYRLNISYMMSNINPKSGKNQISTFSTRIKTVSAQAYFAAADETAREATTVGALITATNALCKGVPQSWGVGLGVFDTAATPPSAGADAYAFDKFGVALIAAGENSQITIPARKMSAVTVETNGIDIELADGAAVADFVSALETVGVDEDLNNETVTRMLVLR
jgi:hypothetical protein